MIVGIRILLLAAMVVVPSLASAQFEVSGLLDIVARNRSATDVSNLTFKKFSNYDFIRARIFFDAAASENASVFTQILIDNDRFHLYGAYVRLSRIGGKSLNLHAGLIPNTVGYWGPRTYSDKNPLISVPLMYNYHTALNPGADQVSTAQLFWQRGRGYARYGWPILYDACWNTGVELYGAIGSFDWSVAAISGTLSSPAIQPEKDMPQFTAKLTCYASSALSIMLNGFAGPYLSSLESLEANGAEYEDGYHSGKSAEDYLNYGGGIGTLFDYGYLEALAEGFWTRWEHPIFGNLDAYSAYLNLRYKFAPQWYLAGRIETIRFSQLDFGTGLGEQDWDYPLNRMELGVGYRLDPSVTLKAVTQIVRCPDFDTLDDETGAIQMSVAIR
ncbi:MAG: hypothetical protein IT585_02915 [candidate division Zixibacteria bacterium]|nr:hypothetical protein [candidate division Zixibacteria bacterium]